MTAQSPALATSLFNSVFRQSLEVVSVTVIISATQLGLLSSMRSL